MYVIGDEAEYRVGGGLKSVLRDPIVKAMAAQKEFEEHDEREDEEDRQHAQEAEETHTQDMLEKLEQDVRLLLKKSLPTHRSLHGRQKLQKHELYLHVDTDFAPQYRWQ